MSSDAVLKFREAVNRDDELKNEIRAAAASEAKLDVVAIAARHGFAFTAAELSAVAGDVANELTEFELEMVAGGSVRPTETMYTAHARMQAATYVAPGTEEEDPDSDC
jgi:predicted ribosomally synthesized peptide with nif11-like leader